MLSDPAFFQFAYADLGKSELPENRGPYIRSLIAQAHCGEEGDPWCAIFVNAKLEQANIRGTRSASSQSFRHDEHFMKLEKPVRGCIVVFWRQSRGSGLGHVGFFMAENASHVLTLGGNEHDSVMSEWLIKDGNHFGLLGYYWPKGVALPNAVNAQVAERPTAPVSGDNPKVT